MLALAVVALTVLLYWPAFGFEFVNYDDTEYVTANPHVAEGLTGETLLWSLTAFVNGNWHPVTLWSHLADVSLHGLRPGGHHATSVLLHAACAALLVWLGFRLSGSAWAAALVAALFAVHPLNVESVAWIAERKNPLSTLFWLLALVAWTAYRRSLGGEAGPRASRPFYGLACGAAALAMAAKPMAVTLPLTLVVLDFLPQPDPRDLRWVPWRRRAAELAPFFAMSVACGLLTLRAQAGSHALQTLAAYPAAVRFIAVPVGYSWYLLKGVWPTGLAVFYPHPHVTGSVTVSLGAAVAIAALTAGAWIFRKRAPWATAGWAWYLVTLAPVAGIVQVGSQAYADRYAYVPLIGVFAALASLVRPRARWAAGVAGVAACVAIAALAFATRAQLAYWKDSVALFEHARAVVPDSSLAWNQLGMAYVERNRVAESEDCFRRAVRFAPWDTDARSNLGSALTVLRRPEEAVAEFEAAMKQAPGDPSIRFNLAKALDDLHRTGEAETQLREAIRLDPSYANAPLFLGILYMRSRRLSEAIPLLERAAALRPRDPRAHLELGTALALSGDRDAALAHFEAALRLDPGNARAQEALRRLR